MIAYNYKIKKLLKNHLKENQNNNNMKSAKEILYEETKDCGIVSEEKILQAMEKYAYQFMNIQQCYICQGTGTALNTVCKNCNGLGKIVLLPMTSNT